MGNLCWLWSQRSKPYSVYLRGDYKLYVWDVWAEDQRQTETGKGSISPQRQECLGHLEDEAGGVGGVGGV